MHTQLGLWDNYILELANESEEYLSKQLITYLGNKRALLEFIGNGLDIVRRRLNKKRIHSFDVFSGSGVVARYLKKFSDRIVVNDIEKYSYVINKCYLSNINEVDLDQIDYWYSFLSDNLVDDQLVPGFITELYSPKDINNIQVGERCFYTPRNAMYLDTARSLINSVPEHIQHFFLGPLLSETSVHANTSGVFKGFYKNSMTGKGQFGGNNKDALLRILGDIKVEKPVFSRFHSDAEIYRDDSNILAEQINGIDVAYIDPPYNQHPYGSNYFMLNLLVDYEKPVAISNVSGIPEDWYRSAFNKKQHAYNALSDLVKKLDAKFLLISFNSEGFIGLYDMLDILKKVGKTEVLETKYNTFRGSRNLVDREIHIKEYLYLVEKY